MLYDCHIDIRDHRPPPARRPLSRTERKRMTDGSFESRVHADATERARLRVDIEDEIDKRVGMGANDLPRLKQITGIAAPFASHGLGQAWTPTEAKAFEYAT